jgi:hypothetical protein
MPYKKQFDTVDIRFANGGSLSSDLSMDQIEQSDWQTKDNFRRLLDTEVMREGWDYWKPNSIGSSATQKFTGTTGEVLAIEEIKGATGASAVVAVVGGFIYFYQYATASWEVIGFGFSAVGIRRWQIVQLNGIAVFNNGIDLPVYWRVGSPAVIPLYELRERGVASVGLITEYSGFLMAADIIEVNASYMPLLMAGPDPYGIVPVLATNASRTPYRLIWSNANDPTDWAATVNYSGTAGSPVITLAWPMASFGFTSNWDVTLVGGGPLGGNLVTRIISVAGSTVTVADNLSTTVSGEPMGRTSAFGSPVGFYDIQDDGAAISAIMPLQNRLVVYRPFSIFIGAATGQVDFPFQFDRVYQGNRTPKLPWMLVNVRGQFHLYPGSDYFYQYKLGALEPEVDRVMVKCSQQVMGFSRTKADENYFYAVDNVVTGEIFFYMLSHSPPITQVICYDYINSTASRIVDRTLFTAARSVRLPIANNLGDDTNVVFIFGDQNGNITQYGRTTRSTSSVIMPRYGLGWNANLITGMMFFGDAFNEKDLRTYVPLFKAPTGTQTVQVQSYYGARTDGSLLLGTDVTVTPNSATPSVIPLWQRGIYHQFSITVALNVGIPAQLALVGHIIEVDAIGSRSVTRLK